MTVDPARVVEQAAEATRNGAPLVLAVSGGIDSMVLLHAMARAARTRIACVATFDHGTGGAATRAAEHVRSVSERLGIPVSVARADEALDVREGHEAAWRTARYAFLRRTAAQHDAVLVTAHTRDDQLETVLMRILRGSGARGLAGLYAQSDVLRPFVSVRRADIEAFATRHAVDWLEDPSNASVLHFRNRVRRDLLPALRRARPGLEDELLALAQRAADWRIELDTFAQDHVAAQRVHGGRLVVRRRELAGYDEDSLAVLWASIASRAGLALDRRGTRRVAAFTSTGPTSGGVPLAGGWCLDATPDSYILGRLDATPACTKLPTHGSLEWGAFRFRVTSGEDAPSPWTAAIPAAAGGVVRGWSAGDRLAPAGAQPWRRVTRYLSDVGVRGRERAGWPVVVSGDDVVWIPGIRRSDAATDRSGRPVRHYVCERIDS